MLNSNIRCIEIFLSGNFKLNNVCWIVTLDVLKCYIINSNPVLSAVE